MITLTLMKGGYRSEKNYDNNNCHGINCYVFIWCGRLWKYGGKSGAFRYAGTHAFRYTGADARTYSYPNSRTNAGTSGARVRCRK